VWITDEKKLFGAIAAPVMILGEDFFLLVEIWLYGPTLAQGFAIHDYQLMEMGITLRSFWRKSDSHNTFFFSLVVAARGGAETTT